MRNRTGPAGNSSPSPGAVRLSVIRRPPWSAPLPNRSTGTTSCWSTWRPQQSYVDPPEQHRVGGPGSTMVVRTLQGPHLTKTANLVKVGRGCRNEQVFFVEVMRGAEGCHPPRGVRDVQQQQRLPGRG